MTNYSGQFDRTRAKHFLIIRKRLVNRGQGWSGMVLDVWYRRIA
jgi:hypothetical protein